MAMSIGIEQRIRTRAHEASCLRQSGIEQALVEESLVKGARRHRRAGLRKRAYVLAIE
jgi:hypothetical protein